MSKDPATAAFVAFCKTGAPDRLGVVFDRLAPELLLVAARLLPPGGDAGDLVQQTFVTALQQRRRFDTGKRIAPWLVGILLQHVRRERRRLRRRIDTRRLRGPSAQDPVAEATTQERAEAVHRAVAALPQPYRQVLQLHLVHGLPAHAVAASLERPFRTVQSQLRRGLHQLRRALPNLALAPWQGPPLAVVRANVLRAASSLLMGWLWLPWLRIAGLLAIVAVPSAFAATGMVSEDPAPASSVQAAGITRDSGVERRADPSPDSSPGPSVGVLRTVRIAAQDPHPTCRVRVRLLSAENQAPLAGATVSATIREVDARGRGGKSVDAGTAISDERGEVVLQLPRGPRHRTDLEVTADGRLPIRNGFDVPDRDEITFDGVALWRVVPGRIRLRDQHGEPVPFVDVRVEVPSRQGFAPHPLVAPTGADGWTQSVQLPLGDFQASLRRVPIEFAYREELPNGLPLTLRGGDNELVLERPDPKTTITGRLVDQQGEPVARGWVKLAGIGWRHRTGADGRFVLPVPDRETGPFRIAGGIGEREGPPADATFERGARDALVELRWPDGLALTVVDAKTGEPVEEFAVKCFRVHADKRGLISGDQDLRLQGVHRDGHVLVEAVEAGENRLLVLPDEFGPWLPSGYLPVSIRDGGVTKLTVKLHRPAPVRVRLAFGDGEPAAGSRVRLRAKLSDDDAPWVRSMRLGRFGSSHWQGRIDLAMATSDARGIAELPWQPWREVVVVRADGPGHLVCERELPGVEPGGEPIELRVARGATIRGSVRGFERWTELAVDLFGKPVALGLDRLEPSVVLRNGSDGGLHEDPEGRAFPIGADGSFVCNDVPPGRWQVLFQYNQLSNDSLGGIVTLLKRALTEVVAIAGQEHVVSFDLAAALPGSIRGRLLVDGVPSSASALTVGSWGTDHLGRPMANSGAVTAPEFVHDCAYAAGRVLPGDIALEAYIDGKRYRLFERIPLAPGEHKQIDLEFRRLAARIRLVGRDGTPVAERLARIEGERIAVDGDGWITLDPAPSLHFDVELYGAGITKESILRIRYDDPRARTVLAGSIDLDPTKARSEHQLTVNDP
ncbi:MAG TPA: sigma-70 family RNA polymerase sigma factor [Planctomycetota bacterium]